jgi:uncharacterized protein
VSTCLRSSPSERSCRSIRSCTAQRQGRARPDAGQRYDDQASQLPEAARKPGGGVKLKGIPPEKLVAKILRYCERRKPELIMPARARLLFALAQLSPTLGDWIVTKMTS